MKYKVFQFTRDVDSFQCQSERDELHSRFVSAIFDLQQKTGLKNVLLEKKLEKLSEVLEQREAQISEVLAAAQLDPAAVVSVNKKLEVRIEHDFLPHYLNYLQLV